MKVNGLLKLEYPYRQKPKNGKPEKVQLSFYFRIEDYIFNAEPSLLNSELIIYRHHVDLMIYSSKLNYKQQRQQTHVDFLVNNTQLVVVTPFETVETFFKVDFKVWHHLILRSDENVFTMMLDGVLSKTFKFENTRRNGKITEQFILSQFGFIGTKIEKPAIEYARFGFTTESKQPSIFNDPVSMLSPVNDCVNLENGLFEIDKSLKIKFRKLDKQTTLSTEDISSNRDFTVRSQFCDYFLDQACNAEIEEPEIEQIADTIKIKFNLTKLSFGIVYFNL